MTAMCARCGDDIPAGKPIAIHQDRVFDPACLEQWNLDGRPALVPRIIREKLAEAVATIKSMRAEVVRARREAERERRERAAEGQRRQLVEAERDSIRQEYVRVSNRVDQVEAALDAANDRAFVAVTAARAAAVPGVPLARGAAAAVVPIPAPVGPLGDAEQRFALLELDLDDLAPDLVEEIPPTTPDQDVLHVAQDLDQVS